MRDQAYHFGIKEKLILIFILIKVIPLVILAVFAGTQVNELGSTVQQEYIEMVQESRDVVSQVGTLATKNSIDALDIKSREAIERLTTDTAQRVADFLHQCDNDIEFFSQLPQNKETYASFLESRKRTIILHEEWVLNEKKDGWHGSNPKKMTASSVEPQRKDNERDFHHIPPGATGHSVVRPHYLEATFFDLNGIEKLKVTTGDTLNKKLQDISRKENTWCRAETYFEDIKKLGDDEIYVSDVIGAYIPSPIIGPYTPESAKRAGIVYEPEKAGYAGKENPVGKRFQGLIRWVKPVIRQGKRIGYVSLALDHTHLMEFTDHIVPSEERYSAISDASTGNYAFMWDHKGRNISHPRDYFIVGYNPQTGDPEVPWLSEDLHKSFLESGRSYVDFQPTAPLFDNQSLSVRPSKELRSQGKLGLDCRYLNFAPQCTGWFTLTEDGGSGSFVIFWSNLWKLTTAATIPYYTGQYKASRRGFGFVTIGANVHEFHSAANETAKEISGLKNEYERSLKQKERKTLEKMVALLEETRNNLTVSTLIMVVIVVIVAIWMASTLTHKILEMIKGIHLFRDGNLSHRLDVKSKDEMGQLALALNEMSDTLQDSIEQINRAREKAEQSDKAKSIFLSSMSHEIRTPLNAIIGMSRLALKDLKGKKQVHLIKTVKQSADSLLSLLNDILDFSKVEAGELVIENHLFDLQEFLTSTIKGVANQAEKKGLDFSYSIDKGVPKFARGDGLRLKQVLHNVLSNGVKFTEKGSIQTDIDLLDVTDTEMRLRVTVEDTGIGIPEDMEEEVFSGFYQVDSTLSREHQGAGLGLAISRKLCRLMGGDISVDCAESVGCTIVFTIQLERVEDIELFHMGKKEKRVDSMNILLVEDNFANRDLARMILTDEGHKVIEAENGLDALSLLSEQTFDVILMDVQMPKMDGLTTTRIIRSIERGRDVQDNVDKVLLANLKNNLHGNHHPIIALTAHAMSGDREKCMAAGMDRYLTKPFMPEQVLAVLYEV